MFKMDFELHEEKEWQTGEGCESRESAPLTKYGIGVNFIGLILLSSHFSVALAAFGVEFLSQC